MKPWDCLIVGGGPAGLYCGIHAAERGLQVLILEKMPSPARKLLISGGGKCNLTNAQPVDHFFRSFGAADHGKFLKPALLNHTNAQTIAFFERLGIATKVVEENQKVFPASAKARDVLDAMLKECSRLGVTLRSGQAVSRVAARDGGFEVQAGNETYACRKLVIATGGKSLPTTGSSGDGYAFAQALGHSLAPLHPGLTPFEIQDHLLAQHAGMSFKNLGAALWRSDRKVAERSGAMVITHTGFSGPVIHNLARDAQAGDVLKLGFVPGGGDFEKEFLETCEKRGFLTWSIFCKQWHVPEALAQTLIKLAGLDAGSKAAKAGAAQRRKLAGLLSAFPARIKALGGFEQAMVTCGGVKLEEVNAKTMESRLVPGLFFVGEVLDLDGDTGGYDLQAAWSTAYLAADHLAKT